MQDLEKDILLTIYNMEILRTTKKVSTYPYARSIASVLNGNSLNAEYFYDFPSFGVYPTLNRYDVDEKLKFLIRVGYVEEEEISSYKIRNNLTIHGERIAGLLDDLANRDYDLYERISLDLVEENYKSNQEKRRIKLDDCMCNRDGAKKFSEEYIYDMADWDEFTPNVDPIDEIFIEDDYYFFPYLSLEEKSIITELIEMKYAKVLRGGSLKIEYKSPFYNKYLNYYPDVVLLTQDNKIAIIEIKQVKNFSNCVNLAKYEALKAYCEENGYMYCMIDKSFNSLTDIMDIDMDGTDVEHEFYRRMHSQPLFTMKDVNEMRKMFNINLYDLLKQLSSIIINGQLVNEAEYDFRIDCKKWKTIEFDLI